MPCAIDAIYHSSIKVGRLLFVPNVEVSMVATMHP